MKKKSKGLVLGIISYALTFMAFFIMVSIWGYYFLMENDLWEGLDPSYNVITIIFNFGFIASCFLFVISAIVLNFINIIKASKIFRIIAIANLVFDLCLFYLFINLF